MTIDARFNALYTSFSGADTETLLSELFFILLGFAVLTLIMIIVVSAAVSRENGIAAAAIVRRRPEPPVDLPDFSADLPDFSDAAFVRRRSEPPVDLPDFSAELPDIPVRRAPAPPVSRKEPVRPAEPAPSSGPDEEFPDFPVASPGDEAAPAASAPTAAGGGAATTDLEWSEAERAERKRERFSSRTGLVRGEYFLERLSVEIERAVSFGEDLALFFVSADAARSGAEPWGAEFADALCRSFGNPELAFEYEPRTAAVVAPGMNIDAAIAAAKRLYHSLLGAGVRACLGITARNGRPVTPPPFIEEAAQALTQAKSGGQSPIVAFRTDG